ncbi:alpha/beta fold hydrolase [Paenibacillus crassostreae]|uniref:AB hydrolase-1 domain-containing protein n=1 Tax=Paenibacillus crassostreae TaxID=1763538 RepID=A0A162N7V3_9BACL|nr:alpha/beta hydrolase [Paenibacillus crassostreae]AOZ93758.1 hypothetical protein LPB68_17210 [Paenibacillus crassostreae]OAB71292.1 hypothetical protein PNBC_20080 [Paenibacillus crassostreae]
MKVFKSEKAKTKVLETYDKLLEMWDVEVHERDIETTYGSTHIIECGSTHKPPLVLFHGVGDNSALMWLYNAKALAQQFHIYAVDTMGGPGKSCPNTNYNKTFNQTQWIDELLDALDLSKVYIAGVSNGGYLVQRFCMERPERVIKAICMASSIFDATSGNPLKTMMKVFIPEAIFPTEKNVHKLILKLTGKNSAVFTEVNLVMEHYMWLLKGFSPRSMAYHKIESFSDDQIGILRGKCLFICGEADPMGDVKQTKEKFEKYGVEYRMFVDVGHGINHEISSEINQVMLDYMRNE